MQLGRVGLGEPRADRGCLVGYSLIFPVHFIFQGEAILHSAEATLNVGSATKYARVGPMQVIQGGHGVVPCVVGGDLGLERNWEFRIDLTGAELTAFDAARNGSDQRIRIDFAIGHSRTQGPTPAAPAVATASVEARIPTSDCLQIMRDSGACDVLEFSLALPHGDAGLAEVVRHLHTAQEELLLRRRPRIATRQVFSALEALTVWLDDSAGMAAAAAAKGNTRDRDLEQRLQVVRSAIYQLAGGAGHEDASAASMPYDLPVARAAVGMCIAIVAAYVERVVKPD